MRCRAGRLSAYLADLQWLHHGQYFILPRQLRHQITDFGTMDEFFDLEGTRNMDRFGVHAIASAYSSSVKCVVFLLFKENFSRTLFEVLIHLHNKGT